MSVWYTKCFFLSFFWSFLCPRIVTCGILPRGINVFFLKVSLVACWDTLVFKLLCFNLYRFLKICLWQVHTFFLFVFLVGSAYKQLQETCLHIRCGPHHQGFHRVWSCLHCRGQSTVQSNKQRRPHASERFAYWRTGMKFICVFNVWINVLCRLLQNIMCLNACVLCGTQTGSTRVPSEEERICEVSGESRCCARKPEQNTNRGTQSSQRHLLPQAWVTYTHLHTHAQLIACL